MDKKTEEEIKSKVSNNFNGWKEIFNYFKNANSDKDTNTNISNEKIIKSNFFGKLLSIMFSGVLNKAAKAATKNDAKFTEQDEKELQEIMSHVSEKYGRDEELYQKLTKRD